MQRSLALEAIQLGAIQIHLELSQLVEFIQKWGQPVNVLEIGTQKGGTLWLWCQLADPQATIVSLDLPDGPFGGGYSAIDVPHLRSFPGEDQTLKLITGNSHESRSLDAVKGFVDYLDFLFIDGDHTIEGVTQDWQMYNPLVRPGGLVVFHDIAHHDFYPECDVKTLWDEIKEDYEHYEFCAPGTQWGGIGVLVQT